MYGLKPIPFGWILYPSAGSSTLGLGPFPSAEACTLWLKPVPFRKINVFQQILGECPCSSTCLLKPAYTWLHDLDVEVLYVEGIVFNEFSACFDVLAHEGCEDGVGFGDIFKLYPQQCAALWVHGGFPKLC